MLIITAEYSIRGIGFLIRIPITEDIIDQLLESVYEEFEAYSIFMDYNGELTDYLFNKYQSYTFLKDGYFIGNEFCKCPRSRSNGDLTVNLMNIYKGFGVDTFIKCRKIDFSGEVMN
ncbi:MAG: hypothetical protein WCO44_13015 [Bacteroidota bacterium]